jgi:hypothetical protein
MIAALINKINTPNVRIVAGSVNKIKIGFKLTFKIANTKARASAYPKSCTCIPLNIYEAITTATAFKNNLIKKFILFFYNFKSNIY